MRLYVLVEGPTEEAFVKRVLYPHLVTVGLWSTPIIVETRRDPVGSKYRGGGDWRKWRRDLVRLTKGQPGRDVRFTTLFDLYGLPAAFPGLSEHGSLGDTGVRAERLEAALAADIGDWRLIPYLQRHEFEALVLAGLEGLEAVLDPGERAPLAELRALVSVVPPEEVNDGSETAPSKRLEGALPSYQKVEHGPAALEGVGLEVLRARCPRFGAWVSRLEKLAAGEQGGAER